MPGTLPSVPRSCKHGVVDEAVVRRDHAAMPSPDGLLPLVIGITGHRNPDPGCIASLEKEVERAFDQLDAAAPHTPFILLSPLARGCDRLAARVAMRFRRRDPAQRIEVIGVLPLAIDDYRRDFAGDAGDAAEFEALLADADDWFELPRWEDAPVDSRGFVIRDEDRDLHYRRLGLFVARQSQVMIAMWDGVRNNKVGGTAEVVDFCMERTPVGLSCGIPFQSRPMLLAPPDSTAVFCIPTRREGAPEPGAAAVDLAARGVGGHFHRDVRDLDLLNRRLAATSPGSWRPAMFECTVAPAVQGRWASVEARFMRLDALAVKAKGEYLRCAWLVPSFAAVAVGAFQWFSSFADGNPGTAWIAMLLYAVFLSIAAAIWWHHARRRRTEWVFVHARALAEALRIQIAWIGSGISEVAPDLYFARRNSEVGFLREQLRACILDCMIVASRGGTATGLNVGTEWADEQAGYFHHDSRSSRRKAQNVRLQAVFNRRLKGLVLLASAGLMILALLEAFGADGMIDAFAAVGCFVVGLALALTVAFGYWKEVVLDREDLDAARRMHGVFDRACRYLADGTADGREILRALGREALDEHAEWFARHRDRLRLPDAG